MILWHMGIAALLTYVTLGRRRIDYRLILAGAVLPDVIDGLAGGEGRGIGHSLLAVIAAGVLIIVTLRGERRLRVFSVVVGWLTHLVADGMWNSPRVFFWPAFGTAFPTGSREPYSWSVVTDPLAHLSTWAGEAIGLAILAWFWVAFRLREEGRLGRFLRDGYLRP